MPVSERGNSRRRPAVGPARANSSMKVRSNSSMKVRYVASEKGWKALRLEPPKIAARSRGLWAGGLEATGLLLGKPFKASAGPWKFVGGAH